MPKIVRFNETGGPDVLKIEELPPAEPGEGEIRLKVEAIGLNCAEVMYRRGEYHATPQFPARLGFEGAGIVDAVGPGVSDIRIGDRVAIVPLGTTLGAYGLYGECALVPAYAAARYPDALSSVEGAALWMQYLTAYGALIEYGKLEADDTVLITAASSSVGLGAIQITKAAGAIAIATTRGADKKQMLLEQGADHVVVTDEDELAESVMAITSGEGARLAFDPVAGPFLEKLAQAAAPHGVIYEYGALYPGPTVYPLMPMLAKSLTIRGFQIFDFVMHPDLLTRGKEYVFDGLQSGALRPVIDSTFPLDAIADAHRRMESNRQVGKIVVTV
jgi:NADPH:quinone reductase-like Zn-dependent oxidoreductase